MAALTTPIPQGAMRSTTHRTSPQHMMLLSDGSCCGWQIPRGLTGRTHYSPRSLFTSPTLPWALPAGYRGFQSSAGGAPIRATMNTTKG